MIIITEKNINKIEKEVDRGFVELKRKYYPELLEINNGNVIKTIIELDIIKNGIKNILNRDKKTIKNRQK